MKFPRDINGKILIKMMNRLGYVVTRQTGSHIRLSRGEHNITVPNHEPIKIGTLSAIVKDICKANDITEEEFFNLR